MDDIIRQGLFTRTDVRLPLKTTKAPIQLFSKGNGRKHIAFQV